MKNDPIVDEVRMVRERIAKEHEYIPRKILEHLVAEGQKHPQERLVFKAEIRKKYQTASFSTIPAIEQVGAGSR